MWLPKSVPLFFLFHLGLMFSSPPSITLLQTSNSINGYLNETITKLTAESPRCTVTHGDNLNEESCRNAWDKMNPFSTKLQKFGPRQRIAVGEVPMPVRYLSDDGICAIDILFKKASDGDYSTGRAIAAHAETIIDQCVVPKKMGGTVSSFSECFLDCYLTANQRMFLIISHATMSTRQIKGLVAPCRWCSRLTGVISFELGHLGDLLISIRSYEPSVDCDPRPSKVPSYESCQDALSIMPVGVQTCLFGTDHFDRRIRFVLPRYYYPNPSKYQQRRPCPRTLQHTIFAPMQAP